MHVTFNFQSLFLQHFYTNISYSYKNSEAFLLIIPMPCTERYDSGFEIPTFPRDTSLLDKEKVPINFKYVNVI